MMKLNEWFKIEKRFYWGFFKDTSPEDGNDWLLDFDAPKNLPDGRYDLFGGLEEIVTIWLTKCIKVKSGKIVPNKTTLDAVFTLSYCTDAVWFNTLPKAERANVKPTLSSGRLWHGNMESFTWNEEHKWFEANFSS